MFQKKEADAVIGRISRDGGRLRINCCGCPGPSSVEDRQCLICICDSVKDESDLESVMLHSSMDVSFQGASLELIRELAGVFSVLTMDASERRGARCRRCRDSYGSMVSDQIERFPDIDIQLLRERAMQASPRDSVCEICLGDTARLFEHLGELIEDIKAAAGNGGE